MFTATLRFSSAKDLLDSRLRVRQFLETPMLPQWVKHWIQAKNRHLHSIKQELAHFSNDQRLLCYEHVVVSLTTSRAT